MNTRTQGLLKAARYFLSLALLLLVGCASNTTSRLSRLSVGMTKAEVLSIMGDPDTVAAQGGAEYLNYTLWTEMSLSRNTWGYQTFNFVRLVNGRVDSFGRIGDFDSTKDPTLNLNIRNR